jgi:dimethylglycine dehydrogenase
MKSHVRAVVIGGVVVGVSTLYHLTRKGWTNVVLLERTELVDSPYDNGNADLRA